MWCGFACCGTVAFRRLDEEPKVKRTFENRQRWLFCVALVVLVTNTHIAFAQTAGEDDRSCTSNEDCAVWDYPACCPSFCDESPPYRAVRHDALEAAWEAIRAECAGVDREEICEDESCGGNFTCDPDPVALCVDGQCHIEVVLEGECGTGCPESCGAQPRPAEGSGCPLYSESMWAYCCCSAGGGMDCDLHLQDACRYDERCRPDDDEGIPTCPSE